MTPDFEGPSVVRPTLTDKKEDSNSLPNGGNQEAKEVPPGQKLIDTDDSNKTEAIVATDRVGPGTGDGVDTRPLGDPDAPQGTGPEVPGGNITSPAAERPAPAGKVRTSWAEQGHTNE